MINADWLLLSTGLLKENERLGQEKRDVQKQFEKDMEEADGRIRSLEGALEELQRKHEEELEEKKIEIEDLKRQIEAMNKQLQSNRRFMDVSSIVRPTYAEHYIFYL